MIVLPQRDIGEDIGKSLGTGLENSLNQFSQLRMNNLLQRQQALRQEKGLMALPGMTPENAKAYSNLDPATLAQVVKETMAGPHRQAFAQAIAQMNGQGTGQGTPGMNTQGAQVTFSQGQPGANLPQLTERETEKLVDWGFKNRKEGREEKQFAWNYFKTPIEESREKATTARKNINHYENIIKLADTGKLRAGNMQQVMKKLRLGQFWRNPETEMAHMELAALAQGAASAFNTKRLTNLDVDLYRQSLIKAGNSPEAMKAAAKNHILEEKAHIARHKVQQEVIKENGGHPPMNLHDLTEEKAQPELKKLADEYQRNMEEAISTSGKGKGFQVGQEFAKMPPAKNFPMGTEITDSNNVTYNRGPKGWIRG